MITVKNLRYRYKGSDKEAVGGIDFQVWEGEIFGFLGPNGAGKSTTQNILIKLLRDYEGEVLIQDRELNKLHADYFERIGVCFEFPNHYTKLTALENLNFFRSLYSGPTLDPVRLLELVHLEKDKDTVVAHFSKGMKSRLSFIRSLLNQPDLLFLDEPTSGLDPVNARIVKDIILEQKSKGKTILLTTHNMHDANELCDRVAFIVDGRIALIDSPRELRIKYGKRTLLVEYRENERIMQEEFPLTDIGNNNAFLQLLKTKNIETIHTQETTLEEIFIKVTGRSLI